jgi:hypothetical protein
MSRDWTAARRWVRPGAARRSLLFGGALFVIGNVLVASLLDRSPTTIRFAEGRTVLANARQLGATPDVLVLGSSIIRSLIDHGTIADTLRRDGQPPRVVFSAAVSAGDALTMDWLLGALDDEGRLGRHLVIEFSPEVLTWPTPFLKEDVTRFFSAGAVLANLPEIARTDARARALSARLLPIHLFRNELLQWLTGIEMPMQWVRAATEPAVAGPAGRPLDAPGYPAHVRRSMLGNRWPAFRLGELSKDAMRAMLRRATARGAAVTIVIPPVASLLRGMETPDGWEVIDRFVAELDYAPGVSIVRYRDRLDDRYFYDAVHATPDGAAAFSALLTREVIAPERRLAPGAEK